MKGIYIVLIILFILIAGGAVWYFGFYKFSGDRHAPIPSAQAETWEKNKTVLFENTTSTDTHKLDDGTFRMYLMGQGGINYADSKDATTFETPQSTGVTESQGKFLSNPSVLKIADNNWIMVYEEAPMQQPGQKQGPPGPESQRNLMLATSTDGKSFTKAGMAIDSSKEKDDNYFASVPDLVKTPDNKIRLYYVCGGEAVCSAISDDGKAWTRETGIRMGDKAVDPDVLYKDGKWVMYFSVLTGDNNRFYRAISTDGLKWTKGPEVLKPDSEQGAIVDPDVVPIGIPVTGTFQVFKWRMFFGEMASGEGQMGGPAQINLYYADFEGDIFD